MKSFIFVGLGLAAVFTIVASKECSGDQFTCQSNGGCIPGNYQCDGEVDCFDHSDELNCTCQSGDFICDNGECIPGAYECDSDYDCIDGSDERNCTCNGFKCTDGSFCLPQDDVCDGWVDCKDASDETDCPCAEDQVRCDDGRCIHQDFWCDADGVWDCNDGSDEANCENGTESIGQTRPHRGLPKLSKMARKGKMSMNKYLQKIKTLKLRKLRK